MIDIKNVTVTYKSQDSDYVALENINLEIPDGEICGIIGPSGCGKSTLLKIFAGIITDYDGSVKIRGEAVMPNRQRIGFIPQNYGLLPWKNVYQNVTLGIKIKDGKDKISDGDVEHTLRRLGIGGLEKRYPNELSGGQQQRVSLARAFILKPDLLLMDEPFSALDAITREEIQDTFLEAWKEEPVSTILVTHHVEEVIYLASKIVILSNAPGKVQKVINNPIFGMENIRNRKEYISLSLELRRMMKEDWINDRQK
ncbi:MAG: Taurine-transporting ATPase [Anaerosolibacter sp.]|jgi:NitT/TauT family transport system ATP-binding protein|uniref:ABC transporter ATP-binding protein n=1 Tax=Anaerosolibacter sp. TaxID=1872527 RepID=UPI00261FCA0F|nr:ABC transporter ATP-binding protein [Anaerosolibacter sp.]MDF2548884.1 Taurine-transporting ATPase [Anaerosolibacter sp.]